MLVSLGSVPIFRSKAEAKVLERGFDPARLPPGQYLTEKWPVLHAGTIPDVDLATWDFAVWGEVENPIRLTWEDLNRLPRTQARQDIHCVTRWSRFDATFEGVHWSELAKLVGPRPSARHVVAPAKQGVSSNVPPPSLPRPPGGPPAPPARRARRPDPRAPHAPPPAPPTLPCAAVAS